MKKLLKYLPILALFTAIFLPSLALATQITVPSSTALGNILVGLSTGNYQQVATSTQNWFSLTTSGSSGASTYSGGTLNIPQYSGGGGVGNWFTPQSYGNSTSTVIGFLAGLFSNGSTTVNGNFFLTPLSIPAGSFLAVNPSGQVIATSTPAVGGSGTVTSVATTYPVTGGTFTTSGTIALAFGTTTSNTWAGTQTFTNALTDATLSGLIAGNSGVTYAVSTTSMNASITGNAGTVTNGVYTTGAGTVYLTPTGSAASLTSFPTFNQNTTGSAGSVANSLTFNSSGSGGSSPQVFNGSGAETISYNTIGAQVAGSYDTFGYPFSNANVFGSNGNSTSTRILDTDGLFASSTVAFGNAGVVGQFSFNSATGVLTNTFASTTVLTVSGSEYFTNFGTIAAPLLQSNSSGLIVSYAGTSCATGAALTGLNQSGSAACESNVLFPFPWTAATNFATNVNSTTTGIWLKYPVAGNNFPSLMASGTSELDQIQVGSTTANNNGGLATSTFYGNVDVKGYIEDDTITNSLVFDGTGGSLNAYGGSNCASHNYAYQLSSAGALTCSQITLTTDVTGTLPPANGGTGVANNAASTVTISGAYGLTLTLSNTTSLTLPTSGTLCTTATCAAFAYPFTSPSYGGNATSSLLTLTGGLLINNASSTVTGELNVVGTLTATSIYSSQTTQGNCVQAGLLGELESAAGACATFGYPFTAATGFSTTANATSSILSDSSGFFSLASSTISLLSMVDATTTGIDILPYGTSVPTLFSGSLFFNTNGTASSSIVTYDGTNQDTQFFEHTVSTMPIASSTLVYGGGGFGASGTTTTFLISPLHSSTVMSYGCKVTGGAGTAWAGIGTGTATSSPEVQCTTTGARVTVTSNNAFKGGQSIYLDIGDSASSPNYITVYIDVTDSN